MDKVGKAGKKGYKGSKSNSTRRGNGDTSTLEQRQKMAGKEKISTWTRVQHSVSVVQTCDGLKNFSINNLEKCNSKSKVDGMIDCWIYEGSTDDRSIRSYKDWINNHKWQQMLQWVFVYILEMVFQFLVSNNTPPTPHIMREIVLKFDEKYPIAHQSPPVPLFVIKKMFSFSPTKGVPSKTECGKLYGSPSDQWKNMRDLWNYLVSDLNNNQIDTLLKDFKLSKNVVGKTKNISKLDCVKTAYEYGSTYPEYVLRHISDVKRVLNNVVSNQSSNSSSTASNGDECDETDQIEGEEEEDHDSINTKEDDRSEGNNNESIFGLGINGFDSLPISLPNGSQTTKFPVFPSSQTPTDVFTSNSTRVEGVGTSSSSVTPLFQDIDSIQFNGFKDIGGIGDISSGIGNDWVNHGPVANTEVSSLSGTNDGEINCSRSVSMNLDDDGKGIFSSDFSMNFDLFPSFESLQQTPAPSSPSSPSTPNTSSAPRVEMREDIVMENSASPYDEQKRAEVFYQQQSQQVQQVQHVQQQVEHQIQPVVHHDSVRNHQQQQPQPRNYHLNGFKGFEQSTMVSNPCNRCNSINLEGEQSIQHQQHLQHPHPSIPPFEFCNMSCSTKFPSGLGGMINGINRYGNEIVSTISTVPTVATPSIAPRSTGLTGLVGSAGSVASSPSPNVRNFPSTLSVSSGSSYGSGGSTVSNGLGIGLSGGYGPCRGSNGIVTYSNGQREYDHFGYHKQAQVTQQQQQQMVQGNQGIQGVVRQCNMSNVQGLQPVQRQLIQNIHGAQPSVQGFNGVHGVQSVVNTPYGMRIVPNNYVYQRSEVTPYAYSVTQTVSYPHPSYPYFHTH